MDHFVRAKDVDVHQRSPALGSRVGQFTLIAFHSSLGDVLNSGSTAQERIQE
jgi:hypothetical protein